MKRTVVVVDDDPDTLDFLALVLVSRGVAVITCADPSGAFELIGRVLPSAVLLDLQTPQDRRAGLTVLTQLRAEPRTATLPVLLMTGDHDALRRHADHIHELGATPVRKPFDVDQVIEFIEQVAA